MGGSRTGTDGRNPNAVLIFDKSDALYSATIGGGAGVGTVFKLTTDDGPNHDLLNNRFSREYSEIL
jgi:hypothetical protein